MRLYKVIITTTKSNMMQHIFHAACILATIGLQMQCIYNYFLNEDTSVVEYRTFLDHKDSLYPSMSFCIKDPFLESKFQNYGDGINKSSFVKFLQGRFWDERMLGIDYDHVTVSLEDVLDKIHPPS